MSKTELAILTDTRNQNLCKAITAITGEAPMPSDQLVKQLESSKAVEDGTQAPDDIRVAVFVYDQEDEQSFNLMRQLVSACITSGDPETLMAAGTALLIGLRFSSKSSSHWSAQEILLDMNPQQQKIREKVSQQAKKLATEKEAFFYEYRIKGNTVESYGRLGGNIAYWLTRNRLCTRTITALRTYHQNREQGPVRRNPLARFSREDKLAAELALRAYLAEQTLARLNTLRTNLPALKDRFFGRASELRGIFARHIQEEARTHTRWHEDPVDRWVENEARLMSNKHSAS